MAVANVDRKAHGAGSERPVSMTVARSAVPSQVYCIVPSALAESLRDTLVRRFGDDRTVTVVVDRRSTERRAAGGRRCRQGHAAAERDLRRVRSWDGRRVADRRAAVIHVAPSVLPRRARLHKARIAFVQRRPPSAQERDDIELGRLVIACQAGAPDALSDLYRRCFDGVHAYLRVMLRNAHDAEDATQQVFEKMLCALDRFELREDVPFRAWMFSIARNEALQHLRRASRIDVEAPGRLDLLRDHVVEPDERLSDGDVMSALERLPLAQRQALTLRHIADLPVDQVADVMGRSATAVRSLEARGRVALGERLTAIGRVPARNHRSAMLIRLRPMPVLAARRLALAGAAGTVAFSPVGGRRW